MAISQELLDILACPETKQALTLADTALVDRLNERIQQGQLTNRRGNTITEPIGGGLVRADGHYLYPIRDDIPIMLIDEAIPLSAS
ncbi:MAG: Trm112 family protein [Candidatus Tectimicrobiota bacterium]